MLEHLKKLSKCNDGYLMAVIFPILIVLFLTGSLVTTLYLDSSRTSVTRSRQINALYLAESGINEAMSRLVEGQKYSPATDPGEKAYPGNPWFTTTVESNSAYTTWLENKSPSSPEIWTVKSRGDKGENSRLVSLDLELKQSPLFRGPVVETKPGQPYYSPDYTYSPVFMPSFTGAAPLNLPYESGLGKVTALTLTGDNTYTDMDIGKSGGDAGTLTLTAPGNLYVDGNLSISQGGARIIINGSGNMNIFIKGDFSGVTNTVFQVNSGVNVKVTLQGDLTNGASNKEMDFNCQNQIGAPPASSLVLYVTAENDPAVNPKRIYLGNNGGCFSGIFAPTANVQVGNNTDMVGAIVAYTYIPKPNGEVLWDDSLGNIFDSFYKIWSPIPGSFKLL